MYRHKFRIALITLLFISIRLSAQTITSTTIGYIPKSGDVNFTEIANYEKAHPKPLVRKLPFDEGDENEARPAHPLPDPTLIHYLNDGGHAALTPHTAYLPVSPSPADTFLAKTSDGTSIPPDTHGGVDSMYAVTAINSSITIENRYTHAVVSSVSLDGFWASQETHGAGAYDPRVHYDPHYKRWIMMADVYGQTNYSTIFIAVSATSSPTGTWHMYKLVVGGTSGIWLDFPCVGFNKKWIAVSGNFFTSAGSFTNDVIYVFDYASMMAGGTMSYGTLNPTGGSFTICPAQTYDTTEVNMFCIENWNAGAGQLRLSKIGGNIGALTLGTVGYPATATHWQSAPNATGNDFVPQLGGGTTQKLQGNDDRINNFSQRNNKLWCAHTIFLPASGTPTRASSMWWQTDTAGAPTQVGVIDDATGGNFYFFPSISSNKNNDALIGFATSSTAIHPSCAYALHMNTDPASSWRPVYTYRHGQKLYFQNFGSGADRWGDYSATCTDPANNYDFWTIQESVPNYTGGVTNSIWDTWWAHVVVCTPLSTAPTAAIAPATQCGGSSALYSVNPVTGASSYTWTITGTGWSGTSTTDSINITAGVGVGTISVAPNNTCGPGAAYTFTVSPLAQAIETLAVSPVTVCVGSSSAVFTATATGGPSTFSWTVLGTGWSGSSTSATLTATVGAGPGTIIVNGTNGCGPGPNDTLIITPASAPAAPAAIVAPTLVCASSTGIFSVTPVTGATGYTWTVAGTGWSGSSTTNSLSATIGSGTGTINVTASNACGTSSSVTYTVTPSTGPAAATSISGPTALCSGTTVTYTTPVIPGATSYNWTVSGTGWSGTSTTNSITVTVGTGLGSITVAGVDACGAGTPFTLGSIAPSATPSALFTESTHVTPDHSNITVTFTGTASTGSIYSWDFGTGVPASAAGPGPFNVHWNTPGTYTVTLTVYTGGCTSTVTDTVHVYSGVGLTTVNNKALSMDITPNPSTGSFDILFNDEVSAQMTVKLSDIQGRMVYSREFNGTTDNKLSVVTNGLPMGNYNVSVICNGNVLNKKVTITGK